MTTHSLTFDPNTFTATCTCGAAGAPQDMTEHGAVDTFLEREQNEPQPPTKDFPTPPTEEPSDPA